MKIKKVKKKASNSKKSKGKKRPRETATESKQKFKYPILTSRLKRWIGAIVMVLLAIVLSLSFFSQAGTGGEWLRKALNGLIGKTIFFIPFLLVLGGILMWKPQKKRVLLPVFCALSLLIIGVSGILAVRDIGHKDGGWLGHIIVWPLFNYFGVAVSFVVFSTLILVGSLIFWEFLPKKRILFKKAIEKRAFSVEAPTDDKKIIKSEKPKFEIKSIEIPQKKEERALDRERRPEEFQVPEFPKELGEEYNYPSLSLLDTKEERPSGGDTEHNGLVIKKTLLNFGIEVEMSEANIGPTVTQYTLKPAEGVKLSRIVSLNNDLALSLASHPIRIEAPIPGRSLVGIEVPNKVRAIVKVGTLIGLPEFQQFSSPLTLALGKDVMGKAIYPELGKMPHLLVAGSTGSGKTICLNSLIVTLVYQNSPKILKFILIDPKRVEFPVYGDLPHLLTPVIFNAQKAVNALNWLVGEMERRFEVLQEAGARDIISYNKILKDKPKKRDEGFSVMSYIVLIIDELADLMAAKGREVEAAIVRLSQLSRAVGIHLVVATQRPSVEVITGLIKANITSRIAFQVASQVDSRTILDAAGAEKLLGRGDMLFLSSEFSKPKRIQGSFVTSAEIKKIVNFIKKENPSEEKEEVEENLGKELEEWTEEKTSENFSEEPLYNDARGVVIQFRKASASLLQRRLKIGYARAARILDILEENGVVGPQDGAKPREVYLRDKREGDGFEDASKVEFDYK